MIDKKLLIQSSLAGIFSFITILILTILTYKTQYGLFLIASFGSTMVLLYGYPESPFAQPKKYNCWSLFNIIGRNNFFNLCTSTNFYQYSISGRFWRYAYDII